MAKAIIHIILLLSVVLMVTDAGAQSHAGTARPKQKVLSVTVPPRFNGDLDLFLSKNIRYPEEAKENGFTGNVTISFMIDEKGLVRDAVIIKDIGAGCGQEALRVIRSMPPWIPGSYGNRPARMMYTQKVSFHLN